MSLSLVETQVINELAGHLYEFLPGSGNNNYSFPIAAKKALVLELWQGGSKRPAIQHLLEATLTRQRSRFCPLILNIVRLSIPWRAGKGNPLNADEIDRLNALLLRLEYKIPELHEAAFRESLAGGKPAASPSKQAVDPVKLDALAQNLLAITNLQPQPRGFAFEKFLTEAFALYDLAPRGSFRLIGEQIDGSFHLENTTYLLEAKWQSDKTGNRDLQGFSGSVRTKSEWTRGLFISYSGFSEEGLFAFGKGSSTPIICMNGQELWQVMNYKINLGEALSRKSRRAAETGEAFVQLSDLYPGL